MSTSFVAAGPFARMTAIHFPGMQFRLRIIRDDGLVFDPQSGEHISIRLYAETGQLLFTGLTATTVDLPGYPDLYFEEGFPGILTMFVYTEGYYTIVLNGVILRNALGLIGGSLRYSLVTEGDRTLETFFPRVYAGAGSPLLITPGTWEVSIPFWSVTSVDTYPDLVTTVRTTTVYASVPYESTYSIIAGNSLGRFLFPFLGVEWTPNADLSGWLGLFQVDNVCTQGEIAIPWQYPNIHAPSTLPTDPGQRIYWVYANVVLQVALGPCSDTWFGTTIDVSSEFGYADVIPFSSMRSAGFQVEQPLGSQPVTEVGKTFVRSYTFQWERSSFQYDTGEEAQRYLGQTATLVQSPAIDFERLTLVPLPETTE